MASHPRRIALLVFTGLALLVAVGAALPAASRQAQTGPAFALGYVHTLGESNVPWFRSAAQLDQPWGVDAGGQHVWIADSAGRRMLRFGNDGGFLDEIGRAGLSHGVIDAPVRFVSDVAAVYELPPGADPNDPDVELIETVWFADSEAHYVAGITRATRKVVLLGEPDVPGDDADHFRAPSSVALDGAGNVYVSDTDNHRVQIFSPDGAVRATIGTSGVAGEDNNHFHSPARLVIGYDGRLYVADAGNHRVQAFDVSDPSAPVYSQTYGKTGQSGSGQFELDTPLGVATDATFVYVADSGNCRVQVLYRTQDKLFDSIGSASGCTGDDPIVKPSDVALDAGGHIYIADPGAMVVHQRKPEDRSPLHQFGTRGVPYLTDAEHYNEPSGVAPASDGALYIAERAGQRLIRREADGSVGWVVGTAGIATGEDSGFDAPADVAVDAAGRAYVADSGNGRVQVFAADGALAATMGSGILACPSGVALAADGRLAVADPCRHVVELFDTSANHVGTLGRPGRPGDDATHLNAPSDAAFDSSGGLLVSDTANHRVQLFDAALAWRATIGQTGTAGDDFAHLHSPSRLAVDGAGRIYVSDTGNSRVQVFAPDRGYLATVGGRTGQRTGELREPLGLAVDAPGRLYVADTANHRVQLFDQPTGPWAAASTSGFADKAVTGITALSDFEGALYAGTQRFEGGAEVWRRDRASGAWSAVATDGFGDESNAAVTELEVFGGQLYAGVQNLTLTTDPTSGRQDRTSTGGALLRSADGVSWHEVVADGFGESRNMSVSTLEEFSGQLYAGTASLTVTHGAQVWRSPSGDAGTWERVLAEVGGTKDNASVSAMAVFTNSLFVGTCNRKATGQLWRSVNGTNWVPAGINGSPNLGSGWGAGCVSALAEFDGYLYAVRGNDAAEGIGTAPSEVWRCQACDGSDWESAGPLGLGDRANRGRAALQAFDEPPFRFLYLAVGNRDGLTVVRTLDGSDWEQVVLGGFGDSNNADLYGADAFAVHYGRLYLGTLNSAHGGELWSTAGARPGIGLPTPPGPTVTPTPRPRPEPPTGRAAYRFEGQWPPPRVIAPDIVGEIVDLAIADDGNVFLADHSNNRVMRLKPDGSWGEPFGNLGRGAERIGEIGAVAVDSNADRVYVADQASERVLVFTMDGTFLDVWPDIYASSLEVAPGGGVWIADRTRGAARLLDASGNQLVTFGSFGNRISDQFRDLLDVTADPAGNLFVSDLDGDRIRGFRPVSGGYERYRTIDVVNQKKYQGCDGRRITAIGAERIIAGRCLIGPRTREDVFPANHRGSDLYFTYLHSANPAAGLYYAMAIYDVDRFDNENETYPAVVRFYNERFDIVTRYWLGRWMDRRTSAADGAIQKPVRLSTAPDGSLMLTDDYGLRRVSADGALITELPTSGYPSRRNRLVLEPELLVGEGSGRRVMAIGTEWVARRQLWKVVYGETEVRRYCRAGRCEIRPYVKVIWDSVLPQMTVRGDGVAAVAHEPTENQFVVLTRYHTAPFSRGVEAIEYRLLIYPLDGWGLKNIVNLPGDDREVIWADVDAGPTGRIYVLDTLNDRVLVLDSDGSEIATVPTPKDAWRVAGGPNGEMYFLTVYGHVVRTAEDGTVLSRFVARPHDGVPPTSLVDIAVDKDGWVYSVDELANQVTVFVPEGTEDDVLIGDKCSVQGDKWADPRDLLLGDFTTLYMSLFGSCGFVEQPTDIVLAINTKGSTLADDRGRRLANTLRSARQIAALTDLDRHRVGVVAYAKSSNVEAPLTHDSYKMMMGLRDARADRSQPSRTYAGLKEASDLFDDESARRQRVIILMEAADNETDAASVAFAEQLKADGVVIMDVNDTSAVSTGDLFDDIEVKPREMGAGKPAHRRMVKRYRPDVIVSSGTLTDKLPSNMRYVPGSARPAATWDAATRTLTWQLQDLALHATHTFKLQVEPLEEGYWPTNVEAEADVLDGWNKPHKVTLPVPKVRVYGELPPTATPTPTATHTPEPTPTPGPTRIPKPVYLPITLRDRCTPKDRNADVALVIDTSGSMSAPTSPGGPSKLEAAKDAARVFLEQLVAGRDQSSIVQFNNEALVVVPLTDDPAVAIAGLDKLTQAPGTRIDLALDAGHQVLVGPDHRPDNNAVLILLTDGKPTGTTEEEVLAAAGRAHEAGILVFTIGLGSAVDGELLSRIASQPDWYYPAPDTSDLEDIYRQIVTQIPCVPRWP